jgi:hypothetical protein
VTFIPVQTLWLQSCCFVKYPICSPFLLPLGLGDPGLEVDIASAANRGVFGSLIDVSSFSFGGLSIVMFW